MCIRDRYGRGTVVQHSILERRWNIMSTEEKPTPEVAPMNIATISAGFEKGDFLVREEQGNRVYFDFFEEVSVC